MSDFDDFLKSDPEFNDWLQKIEQEIKKEFENIDDKINENEFKLLCDLHFDTFGPFYFVLNHDNLIGDTIKSNIELFANEFFNLIDAASYGEITRNRYFNSKEGKFREMNQDEMLIYNKCLLAIFNTPEILPLPMGQDYSFRLVHKDRWNRKGTLFFPTFEEKRGNVVSCFTQEELGYFLSDDILPIEDAYSAFAIIPNDKDVIQFFGNTIGKAKIISIPTLIKMFSVFVLEYGDPYDIDVEDFIWNFAQRMENIGREIIDEKFKNSRYVSIAAGRIPESSEGANGIFYNVNTGKFSGKLVRL